MIANIAELLEVSTSVVWALVALVVVQVAVQVWALVDLARRRRVRFDAKWLWAVVIIVFGSSFLGPILYAAIGRNVVQEPETLDESASEPSSVDRTRRAVDALYGKDEDR